MITVVQCVRIIARPRDGFGRRQRRPLRLGFPMRFLLEQRDLAREHVEPLLFRLRDEGPLIDRQLRIVDERIGQIIIF